MGTAAEMWIEAVVVFFFSSRRRHTRWTGDWSSDVCSSDLPDNAAPAAFGGFTVVQSSGSSSLARGKQHACATVQRFEVARSEERRVGKECRSGWATYE